MTNVTGTTITMTRGDTLRVQIAITRDDEPYVPVSGDAVNFYLKHAAMNGKRTAYKDENPLVSKTVPIETMILELLPTDTKTLDFGEYVYDLQITFENGTVDTFINNASLEIVPEVG